MVRLVLCFILIALFFFLQPSCLGKRRSSAHGARRLSDCGAECALCTQCEGSGASSKDCIEQCKSCQRCKSCEKIGSCNMECDSCKWCREYEPKTKECRDECTHCRDCINCFLSFPP